MKKTKIYCPGCKLLTISTVVDEIGSTRIREKRVSMANNIDIQLFQRIRHCTHCGHDWKTAEVDYALLEELVVLRSAVDLSAYTREQLSVALNKLTENVQEVSVLIKSLDATGLLAREKRRLSKIHQLAIRQVISQRQQKS